MRSHLSALQNCALLSSTNFQFIFTIKNALHNLVIESFSAPKYFKNTSRLFIFGLEIWEPVNPLMNFFPMLEIHMTTLRTALDCMFSLGTVEEPPISSNFHLTSGMVLWWIFGKPTVIHRWELLGNYHDFIRVVVFYLFFWRSIIILVTAVFCYTFYIYIQSLMILI